MKVARPSKSPYLMLGLPIITSNTVGSTQIIRPSFGIILEKTTSDTLSQAVDLIIDKKDLRDSMKDNAIKEFEKKYDWNTRIIPQYLRLYEQLQK